MRMPFRAHYRCTLPIWLWLILATLSFVGRPVLSTLGELHATTHADLATHSVHSDHASPDESEGEGVLHGLMHATLCCGHLSALPGSAAVILPPRVSTMSPCSFVPRFESESPLPALRPPIAA